MVIAQQSRSGSCVLTCVPLSCQVVSTGEIGTQPLYLPASNTGYTYVSTSSQLAWWRTVSLGTYWYCWGGVLVYTYSGTACTVNSLRSNKFHQFIMSLLQVIRDIRTYIPPHSSPGGVPFPWVCTGTAAAVYSYIRTAVLFVLFFFCFCHRDAYCRCLSCFVCHHGLDFRKRAS